MPCAEYGYAGWPSVSLPCHGAVCFRAPGGARGAPGHRARGRPLRRELALRREAVEQVKPELNRELFLFFLSLSSGCWCVTSEREKVSNAKNDDETNADDDEKQRCFEFVDK